MANKKKGEKHCHSILDNKTNNKRIQPHFSQPLKNGLGKNLKERRRKQCQLVMKK